LCVGSGGVCFFIDNRSRGAVVMYLKCDGYCRIGRGAAVGVADNGLVGDGLRGLGIQRWCEKQKQNGNENVFFPDLSASNFLFF